MTDTTKLPPRPALPSHPWPRDYQWTESELRAIEQYGAECRRMALEEAFAGCLLHADEPGGREWIVAIKYCLATIRELKESK